MYRTNRRWSVLAPLVRSSLLIATCCALVGCGHDGKADGSVTTEPAPRSSQAGGGRVIDPRRVPGALRRTPFKIAFRNGPRPAGVAGATYGTSTNARGVSIEFGFFLPPGPDAASELSTTALRRLVPKATAEGTIGGKSYLLVTSARGGAGTRVSKEQFRMMAELEEAVAALAPQAHREESP